MYRSVAWVSAGLSLALIVAGCSHDKGGGSAIGAACTTHADCDGLCLDPVDGSDPYCTDTCDASTMPCPSGFDCTELTNLGFVCVRSPLGELGDPCTVGADCVSGFCRFDVCSECEDNGDCPGAQDCVDDATGLGYSVCQGGAGALGDPCTDGTECASGFCNGDVCSECEGNGDCDGSQTCVDDTAGVGYFVCRGGAGALGDACTDGSECASGFCNGNLCSECESNDDCTLGTCVDDTAGVGYFVCQAGAGALGDDCTVGTDCLSAFCFIGMGQSVCSECEDNGDCGTDQTCTFSFQIGYAHCTGIVPLGDPCATGADCQSGFCNSLLCSECETSLDCSGGGTCVDDTAGVGYFVCQGGLGDTCTVGTDCNSGFCYPTQNGPDRCSECEGDGDCGTNQACTYDWQAEYASCTGTLPLGDPCTDGAECESGFCNSLLCSECEANLDCGTGGTCFDDTAGAGYFICLGPLGSACQNGDECASGFCYVTPNGADRCSECETANDCGNNQLCTYDWQALYASCTGSTPLGDACTSGADCVSGFCNSLLCSECEGSGDCTNGTCVDDTAGVGYFVCLGDLAAVCQSGADCASGLCYNPPGPGPHYCSECETDAECSTPTPTCTWDGVALYASCQ